MIHNRKTYFLVKNTKNGMFWNDENKAWQNISDRLDVYILAIADDQDSDEDVENEYNLILNNMNASDKNDCSLFKIHVETKIIF